ncbi:YesL family protein [Pseudogracilibacillus sp. SO30301A]|uniref:YesL family protein n=1 Tax=Pseudogracilibacillus sp. SO30301A TaxID=3098291 RepID=UPI00300E3B92
MGLSSGFMGGLHRLANWFMRLTIINIIWFIMNLPIFIIVISALQHEYFTGNLLYSLPALLFFPLLLFPSTIAMYATVRDWIMRQEQPSIIKSYFTYFKDNYKESLLSGIAWAIIWFVWMIDIVYFYGKNELLIILFAIGGIGLFIMNINYFSIFTHYHMKVKDYFKHAFFVTIGSPLLCLSILIIHFILITSIVEIWFLLPFFLGTASAMLSFYVFYRFALKIQRKTVESQG